MATTTRVCAGGLAIPRELSGWFMPFFNKPPWLLEENSFFLCFYWYFHASVWPGLRLGAPYNLAYARQQATPPPECTMALYPNEEVKKILTAKHPYYEFGSKYSMSGIFADFSDHTAYAATLTRIQNGETLPDNFAMPGIMTISSGSKRPYDIFGNLIISERLAEVVHSHGGPRVKLFPIHQVDDPKAKFKVGMKFYLWQPPVISCLSFEYGDEMPTSEEWRKQTKKFNNSLGWDKPIPTTNKPVTRITLELDKLEGAPLFIPKEYNDRIFASRDFVSACKKAKIWGINCSYSAHECLEGVRRVMNENNGISIWGYERRLC